jgi:polysaccharide export outer membrane protein
MGFSHWRILAIGISGVTSVLLAACAPTTGAAPLPAVQQSTPSEYRLGLGDKLRITVYGDRELSGEYQVSGKGVVTMPLIGEVEAKGSSARELEARIADRLRSGQFILNPSVSAEVFSYRPYYVIGEVAKPGAYPALEGTTILGAIATAGGYSYRAYTKEVLLRRSGEDQEYSVNPGTVLYVQPGDVVRVAERHF